MNLQKCILHGGFAQKAKDAGRSYCFDIIGKNLSSRILECLFAEKKENWKQSLERDKQMFLSFFPKSNFIFDIAEEDSFSSQIELADIIIFRGGDTYKLINSLKKNLQWINKLENKTVAATSAGVYALSELYLDKSQTFPSIKKGLGILPIKSIVHYQSNFYNGLKKTEEENIQYWEEVDYLMQKERPDLQVIALKEGEHCIYEVKKNLLNTKIINAPIKENSR